MKCISLFICVFGIVISTSAFAGDLQFDCSNADGSVKIQNQGASVSVYGALFNKVKMTFVDDLELTLMDDSGSGIEVVGNGSRIILDATMDKSCREITTVQFVQPVIVKDSRNKINISSDENLICHYRLTTSGGMCND